MCCDGFHIIPMDPRTHEHAVVESRACIWCAGMLTSAELHEEARRWVLHGGRDPYEGDDVPMSESPQYPHLVPQRFSLRLNLSPLHILALHLGQIAKMSKTPRRHMLWTLEIKGGEKRKICACVGVLHAYARHNINMCSMLYGLIWLHAAVRHWLLDAHNFPRVLEQCLPGISRGAGANHDIWFAPLGDACKMGGPWPRWVVQLCACALNVVHHCPLLKTNFAFLPIMG